MAIAANQNSLILRKTVLNIIYYKMYAVYAAKYYVYQIKICIILLVFGEPKISVLTTEIRVSCERLIGTVEVGSLHTPQPNTFKLSVTIPDI